MYEYVKRVSGTAVAADGAVDATVIAAPGAGKRIYVRSIALMITVGGADAGGIVALEDGLGGTPFIQVDADADTADKTHNFNFSEPGFPLSINTLLNITTSGDGTTEATGRATVTGYVL